MRNTPVNHTGYKTVCMPKKLYKEVVELADNKPKHDRMVLFFSKLSDDYKYRQYSIDCGYRPMARNYLLMILGRNYSTVIKSLMGKDIIQRTPFYKPGIAYCYRINPKYLIDANKRTRTTLEKVKIKYGRKTTKAKFNLNNNYLKQFKESMSRLETPKDKLYAKLEDYLENISISDFKLNSEIVFDNAEEVTQIFENGTIKSFWVSKEKALMDARKKSLCLVQNANRIFMTDLETFLVRKKNEIQKYYTSCIENILDPKCWYARRNDTNRRLDTNLTNMPKILLNVIYEHNSITEIDLKNSQPTLLASLLDEQEHKEDDMILFIRQCQQGTFYEYMAKKISEPRKIVKLMMFSVLFGGHKSNSSYRKLFKAEFPSVDAFLTDYKKKHGDEQFSIDLQKKESAVFIDDIYPSLADDIPILFTKHDSVAVHTNDLEFVKEKIISSFKRNKMFGVLDLHGETIKIAA